MNWHERFARAENKGNFTPLDYLKSQQWKTCAVGEIFNLKKIDISITSDVKKELSLKLKERKTNQIIKLGIDFSHYVKGDYVKQAKQTYNQIKKIAR